MGSRERRARERTETRERILDAAREMFVKRGYEATTMRAIAERIEYTPTAIYHHFANKDALLTELCALDFRALGSAFQRIGRVDDPIERLRRIGEAYVAFALEHPAQYELLFMTRRPPDADEIVARGDPSEDAYAFLCLACEAAVASGRIAPEYDDPKELAQILWSSLHGLLSLHIAKHDNDWIEWRDTRKTAAHMRQIMMKGILREEPRK